MHAGNPRAAYKDIILFRSDSVGWRKYSSLNRLTISFDIIFMHCIADESKVPISGSALSAHVPIANVKIAVRTFCRGVSSGLAAASIFRTKKWAFETN
jgi:hypothetical protein